MKALLLSVVLFTGYSLFAQVGIGTSNPTAQLEINTSSSTVPPLELNPQTAPIGSAAGQLSVIGDQLYLFDDTRAKWLTVGSSTFNFGREGSLNNIQLEYAGDITRSGPNMSHDGTIVYLALNSSGGNTSKGITLAIYNSARTLLSSHPLQLIDGKLLLTDVNIDFSAGDYFMVEVDDGGSVVDDVSFVIWTKWRK